MLLARGHLERMGDIFDAEPEQAATGLAEAPPLSGRIELRRRQLPLRHRVPLGAARHLADH